MTDSKLYSVLSGLYSGINALNDRKKAILSALNGYTDNQAVSAKFAEIDATLANVGGTMAGDSISGLMVSGGKATIENGQITEISEAVKVSNKLTAFGKDYDGSVSAEIKVADNSYLTQNAGVIDITVDGEVAEDNTGLVKGGQVWVETNALSTAITGTDGINDRLDAIEAQLDGIDPTVTGAIDAALTTAKNYTDALSTALINGAEDYKDFSAVETKFDEIDGKLDGIDDTVIGYVDDKIEELALDKALTGVVDPQNVITLGVNDAQQITGAFLYDAADFTVGSDHKLALNIKLSGITQDSDSQYASQYALVDGDGNQIGTTTINIAKDQFLSNAEFITTAESPAVDGAPDLPYLKLTFNVAEGGTNGKAVQRISVKDLVDTYVGSAAITLEDGTGTNGAGKAITLKLDSANNDTASFMYIDDSNGLGLSGIQAAIDNAANSAITGAIEGLTTDANTIKGAINEVDSHIDELSGKVSGAFTDDMIVIGTGTGIEASELTLGADNDTIVPAPNATADVTATANKVATEAAVNAAIDSAVNMVLNGGTYQGVTSGVLNLDDLLGKINGLEI